MLVYLLPSLTVSFSLLFLFLFLLFLFVLLPCSSSFLQPSFPLRFPPSKMSCASLSRAPAGQRHLRCRQSSSLNARRPARKESCKYKHHHNKFSSSTCLRRAFIFVLRLFLQLFDSFFRAQQAPGRLRERFGHRHTSVAKLSQPSPQLLLRRQRLFFIVRIV